MKYGLLTLSLFFLAGCSTVSQSDMKGPYEEQSGFNSSVKGIIRAFQFAVPGGRVRGRSKNGRRLVSGYHPLKGNAYEDATTKQERAYVKLSIRGDRRPYTLRVQYVIQRRNAEERYNITGYDEGRAKKVLKKMRRFLVSRPDRSDFIDDFRAF